MVHITSTMTSFSVVNGIILMILGWGVVLQGAYCRGWTITRELPVPIWLSEWAKLLPIVIRISHIKDGKNLRRRKNLF